MEWVEEVVVVVVVTKHAISFVGSALVFVSRPRGTKKRGVMGVAGVVSFVVLVVAFAGVVEVVAS